jgi:hypothetical protein
MSRMVDLLQIIGIEPPHQLSRHLVSEFRHGRLEALRRSEGLATVGIGVGCSVSITFL